MQVGVIGLGKLGLPLALCLADVGYRVKGYDKNASLIDSLCKETFLTHEPSVMELLASTQAKENLEFSNNAKALCQSKIVYIIVPTPSNSLGVFDSVYVEKAIQELLEVWSGSDDEKTIVIVSTVMPGTSRVFAENLLFQRNIKLIYSPEFIALGTVVENLKNPDAILVGCSHELDSKTHIEVQKKLAGEIPVSLLSWEEAEVVKLLVNCYVTMKISFANFIGEICDVLPGANPKKVASALGVDSRIGGKYLSPGLGYAGPCFPRDNRALTAWSREKGLNADLATATQSINSRQPSATLKRLSKFLVEKSSVLIVGLVYKPRTEVLEHSQSLELARELKTDGHSVHIFDPYISTVDKSNLELDFQFVSSLSDSETFDLVVISPGFEFISESLNANHRIYKF